jgi:hypothetical protein
MPARAVPPVAAVSRRRPAQPGPASPPDPAGGTPLPPAWGWKLPYAGRAAHVQATPEWQATTVQACGLNPFVTGAGAPLAGTPVGRDQLHGSVVCLDPLAWMRAGLVTNPGLLLLGEPGVGKALGVHTLIPTPQGWTTIGRLQPGDRVFDENGQPAPVLAVSQVMIGRPCLEVMTDGQAAIIADASHQWVTTMTAAAACVPGRGPGTAWQGTRIRTTREIMDTLTGPDGGPAHRIAVAGPLQLPGTDLMIPPYLLGAWLAGPGGDAIPGVPPAIRAAAARAGYQPGRPDPLLRTHLRSLGVLDRPHIPGRYLRSSAAQRQVLLDGLFQASRTAPRHGAIAYVTGSSRLARDVRELACTLGYPAVLLRPPPGGPPGRDTWTVLIPAVAPAGRTGQASPEPARWQVISVRPVPSRPVRCIQVASAAGLFLAGEALVPTHNSTLAKRLAVGAAGRGHTVLVLGDPRPDYTMLAEHLGGQVIRVGRGMDKINPLDAGPLGSVLPRLPAAEASRVLAEVRARRLSLLMALATLIRGRPMGAAEEIILGRAVDLLDEHGGSQVTVPDVLKVVEEGPEELRAAARASTPQKYRDQARDLIFTLDLLLTGTLAGVFDGQTTTPIDAAAPMVSVDISRAGVPGDKLLTAAMLSTWAYGFAVADAAALLADQGLAPRRSWLVVQDELWRALRGAPGLVEHADSLTRLNRAKGMASLMITHSLADLDALPTEEDRAKARGFIDRAAITVLAALPPRELARVSEITPLTRPERDLVASWSAPDSWQPGARHPGRGKYLLKTGGRLGIAFDLSLVGEERRLYDTDQAIRPDSGRFARNSGTDAP